MRHVSNSSTFCVCPTGEVTQISPGPSDEIAPQNIICTLQGTPSFLLCEVLLICEKLFNYSQC